MNSARPFPADTPPDAAEAIPAGLADRGVAACLVLEVCLPLLHAADWWPESLRGFCAALALVLAAVLAVVLLTVKRRYGVELPPGTSSAGQRAERCWLCARHPAWCLWDHLLLIGLGLALRQYAVLLLGAVYGVLYFAVLAMGEWRGPR